MVYVYPDFYPDFECTANQCAHTCCRGWEIDVDEESMSRYAEVNGAFGDRLKKSISTKGGAHFILTEDESCPFLRKDGLCDMILELGMESLCDICAAHPRFYTEFPDRLEIGLGLCCEEAVKLLLGGDGSLCLVEEIDGDFDDKSSPTLQLRGAILDALCDSTFSLKKRVENALRLVDSDPTVWDLVELSRLFLSFEQMDGVWTSLMESISAMEDAKAVIPENIQAERLMEYFIFRHFAKSESAENMAARLHFAVMSASVIFSVSELCGLGLNEAVRLYSSEIEYSEENTDAVLKYISSRIAR